MRRARRCAVATVGIQRASRSAETWRERSLRHLLCAARGVGRGRGEGMGRPRPRGHQALPARLARGTQFERAREASAGWSARDRTAIRAGRARRMIV